MVRCWFFFLAAIWPVASFAQFPLPAKVAATFVGLRSNNVGLFALVNGTLWVSAERTISRMTNAGATQFDWVSYEVPNASGHSDESITAFAVDGQRIAVATAHTEQSQSLTFGVGDGVYLSADGGQTWAHHPMTEIFLDRQNMTIPGGDTQCFGMWFDGPNLWAAYTSEFAVMTPDFGRTWLRYRPDSTSNPLPNPFPGDPQRVHRYRHLNYRAFDGLVVRDTLWISTNAGVNRSTDGGITWVNYDAAGAGLTGDFVPAIAADTLNGVIWAATQATGIDEAALKENPQDFFPDGKIDSLDYDLDRDGRIDGPGRDGISWTRDGGKTWRGYVPADDPAIGQNFRAWNFAFSGQTVWAAGTSGGVDALLRSDDGGESWVLLPVVTELGDTVKSAQGLADVAYAAGALWATTARGLARSTDGGHTWRFVLRYPQTHPLGGGDAVNPAGPISGVDTYAFPSPSAPRLGTPPRIVFALRGAADVTIHIYDAGGALVRTLQLVNVQAGNHAVEWDGRTDDGRWVANGVYLYQITTGDGQSALGKLMVSN